MTRIYVFTSTGTSLAVAETIAAEMEDAEILSIAELSSAKDHRIEGTGVGFIFPCHYGDMPHLVRDFIERASIEGSPYFFAVATAGRGYGRSFRTLEQLLNRKGAALSYSRLIAIASNYMNGWYYDLIRPAEDEFSRRINHSREICRQIAADTAEQTVSLAGPDLPGYIIPHLMTPRRYWKDPRPWDSEFAVTEKCTGCSVCSRICPVGNIEIREDKPRFGHNCQRCMACVQFCPQSAYVIKDKPMDKVKYRHPSISMDRLIRFNRCNNTDL